MARSHRLTRTFGRVVVLLALSMVGNASWTGTVSAQEGHPALGVSVHSDVAVRAVPRAAISGTVIDAVSRRGLAGVYVEVISATDEITGTAVTGASGRYEITGLDATTSNTVCFGADAAAGGSSTTGYSSQCYHNIPWTEDYARPAGTTPVVTRAGRTTGGVNAALKSASAISGRVSAALGGGSLSGVNVFVWTDQGNYLASVRTGTDGTYRIIGLPESTTGEVVCFFAGEAVGGGSTTGYVSECYRHIPWITGLPAGTTPVVTRAGRTTAGIDTALATAGAISGRVAKDAVGTGLGNVEVDVFDDNDVILGTARTAADGHYRIIGLPASLSGYRVCFNAFYAAGSTATTGYVDQCFSNIRWNGVYPPPARTTMVPIVAGRTSRGISAALCATAR